MSVRNNKVRVLCTISTIDGEVLESEVITVTFDSTLPSDEQLLHIEDMAMEAAELARSAIHIMRAREITRS